MRKEELSIGNLVKYKDKIYIVKSIFKTDICIERGNDSIYVAPCNIDAIPISHNWFKSLKYRVQLQPKQEWSKEDKEMMQVAINACCSYQNSLVRNDSRFDKAVKAEDWLKSLKVRYTWKPTDKQIECLNNVVTDAKCKNDISTNSYEPYIHLSALLQQLKKLKE